jgi:endonuclease YncB( thermonuclease family)
MKHQTRRNQDFIATSRNIENLDRVHRPKFKYNKIQRLGNWICVRPQVWVGDTYSVGSLRRS